MMLAASTVSLSGRISFADVALALCLVAASVVVSRVRRVALGIVPTGARAVIPLGSMIIASAMNTTSLVMTRLRDGLAEHRREVEARLSLGQTGHEAAAPWHRSALRTGMLPTIDQTKVVGLVALPGAMTGMILAGASAQAAIRLQLVVMYMLLG